MISDPKVNDPVFFIMNQSVQSGLVANHFIEPGKITIASDKNNKTTKVNLYPEQLFTTREDAQNELDRTSWKSRSHGTIEELWLKSEKTISVVDLESPTKDQFQMFINLDPRPRTKVIRAENMITAKIESIKSVRAVIHDGLKWAKTHAKKQVQPLMHVDAFLALELSKLE